MWSIWFDLRKPFEKKCPDLEQHLTGDGDKDDEDGDLDDEDGDMDDEDEDMDGEDGDMDGEDGDELTVEPVPVQGDIV